jgi:hypothetical protein
MIDLILDAYERKARLFPGLIVALPLLVPLVCVYGPRHPVLTSVVAVLGGCGAIYALSSVARGRGKRLEEKLVRDWGGMPTTIALRHRDTATLDNVSKQRYHTLIASKLQIDLPTSDQEAADPAAADERYKGATRRLRELTRGNKGLLLKENIAYGFHRNMLAMKPIGILTALLGVIYGLVICKALSFSPLAFQVINLAAPGLAAALTLLVSAALLFAWTLYFDKAAVQRIGMAYAERLFECLDALPQPRRKSMKSEPSRP